MDYEAQDDVISNLLKKQNNQNTDSTSKLDIRVRNLISLIFNVNDMIKQLVELEIDTEKMPLGKLRY
jgi:hypothetical protein